MRFKGGSDMHAYADLARLVIEEFVRYGTTLRQPDPLPDEMKGKAGVFVSIKKQGHLRGCIGTFMPAESNLFLEISRNACAAATEDPRFPPLRPEELSQIEISVDVLSEPFKIGSIDELDAQKYGVIVAKDYRKGLLLPDLDGVPTVDDQLRIAKMKAGISPSDPDVDIYKFTVSRYR